QEWDNLLSSREEPVTPFNRAAADRLARWIPKINRPPAPGSAHRVLTYEKSTGATTWEGKDLEVSDPVPELR
ncbi:MAG: hypothetical protein MK312_06670, partial [Roseibacillus sp.]|nr:hypothetical protein [Roseibacillus sp.]